MFRLMRYKRWFIIPLAIFFSLQLSYFHSYRTYSRSLRLSLSLSFSLVLAFPYLFKFSLLSVFISCKCSSLFVVFVCTITITVRRSTSTSCPSATTPFLLSCRAPNRILLVLLPAIPVFLVAVTCCLWNGSFCCWCCGSTIAVLLESAPERVVAEAVSFLGCCPCCCPCCWR